MNEELLKKLTDDMLKSGFGSELQAKSIFNKNQGGWNSKTNNSYYDLDEEKLREIDLISYRELNLYGEPRSILTYTISCEVKKSKTPWVAFKSNKHYRENDLVFSDGISTSDFLLKIIKNTKNLSEHMGYMGSGMHEAFKNPDQPSRWYSAFISAIKSSLHELKEIIDDSKQEQSSDELASTTIFMDVFQPIVILDGSLLSVEMKNDELSFQEEQYMSFQFEYATKKYGKRSYDVDVVTLNFLDEYLWYSNSRIDGIIDNIYTYIEEKTNTKIHERGTFMYKYPDKPIENS